MTCKRPRRATPAHENRTSTASSILRRFGETNPISSAVGYSARFVEQCLDRRARLILIASVGRQLLPTADAETALSILWFAAIQGIKRKQDLAGLAPKGCFIPAEAIECVVGQIGETQKATRELSGRINCRSDSFRHGAGHDFCSICDTVRFRREADRVSPPEQRIDNLSRGRVNGLPEPTQMVSLNFRIAWFPSW